MNFLTAQSIKIVNKLFNNLEESKYGYIVNFILWPILISLFLGFIIYGLNKFYKSRRGQKNILKVYFKEKINDFKELILNTWAESRGGVILVGVLFAILFCFIAWGISVEGFIG